MVEISPKTNFLFYVNNIWFNHPIILLLVFLKNSNNLWSQISSDLLGYNTETLSHKPLQCFKIYFHSYCGWKVHRAENFIQMKIIMETSSDINQTLTCLSSGEKGNIKVLPNA